MYFQEQHRQIICILIVLACLIISPDVCTSQNFNRIAIPALTVEAENFISNSGNITIVNEKKNVIAVKTSGGEAWLSYKINVPISGRYSIRLFVKSEDELTANCWIEDHVNNSDGRTYNISGNMQVREGRSDFKHFIQKDGAPLAAGFHYLKLHIDYGVVVIDKITFSMIKEHKSSPNVFKQNTNGKEWQMVWSDEFNGQGLPDTSKWTFDIGNWGWGNNELQYYTSMKIQNARQENGNLIIEARKDDNELAWSSARLTTRGKESFLYGKIDIRAKVPMGRGTWSAGWLLGDEYTDESSWPYCGEVDILENVGFEIDDKNGNGKIHASIHCGAYYFKLGNQPTAIMTIENMDNAFHTYTLKWMPDSLIISVDGRRYFNYHDTSGKLSWPFNQPQNLILNLAIGGGWGGAQGMDPTLTTQTFMIDYVRVYELQ